MVTLGAWLHTLDPFLVRFSETFGVRWYGLSYLMGFFVAYVLLRWLCRRGACLIPEHRAADAMLWLIGGVLVGGRLGYCLVYQPSLLTKSIDGFPFWGVLALNEGGMASHGGIIGVVLAGWRVSRGFRSLDPATPNVIEGRCPWQHVADVLALLCPAGMFFGRVANFINGELLGAVVSPPGKPGPWWTVQFPQELLSKHAPALSPEQETTVRELARAAALPGEPLRRGLERLVENASAYSEQLRPLLSSRHPSQLYQALAEGVVVGLITWAVAARPRKPGVVGSVWLIAYGVMRVVTEIWRLPDDQFAVGRPWGLSRGQWLSVGMVVIGTGTLVWCWRRGAEKVGGWRKRGGGAGVSGRAGG
jgi:phosphatidylglycerol:prolipoprotein diacylglycerol transferase